MSDLKNILNSNNGSGVGLNDGYHNILELTPIRENKLDAKEVGLYKSMPVTLSESNSSEIPLILKNRSVYLNESWDVTENIVSRVYKIDKNSIVCECILDKENRIIEKRIFKRKLFSHLNKLSIGNVVMISVKEKPGSSRIDVYNYNNTIDSKIFANADNLKLLMESDFLSSGSVKDVKL